ncbi:MAG: dihydrolipoyl dehydrogenase, partial [Candidatus Bathyarchaeia archaeon]
VAAVRASQLGAKVTLVEKEKLGGVCTNIGCIPTKALLRSAELVEMLKESPKHGITIEKFTVSFAAAMARANGIASTLSEHVNLLMKKHRVDVIYGFASLEDGESLSVKTREGTTIRVRARKIIVASGSSPFRIPIPGSESVGVVVSDDLFKLTSLPRRVVIAGAGAVGLEWAAIFRCFGSEVTVLEMMPQILPSEDEEVARNMTRILEKQGVGIHVSAKASRIDDSLEGGKILTFETEEGLKKAEGDLILLATGRKPNTAGLGLEKVGVILDRGWIAVDDHMQTNISTIYAVGDVVGRFMLAHVAMQEGLVAAENAMDINTKIDYNIVPRCVYTHPEVASIGLSENEAKKERPDVESATYLLRANGRALTLDRIDGMAKLVYEKRYGAILGAQIISPEASEMIHEMSVAKRLEATAEDLASLIHAHPTLSEILREVSLRAVGRPLHG